MSRAETSLSRQIFAENFSGVMAQVADHLMSNGPKTLIMICKGCKLRVPKVSSVQTYLACMNIFDEFCF